MNCPKKGKKLNKQGEIVRQFQRKHISHIVEQHYNTKIIVRWAYTWNKSWIQQHNKQSGNSLIGEKGEKINAKGKLHSVYINAVNDSDLLTIYLEQIMNTAT
jgi:predicted RNA-binding protein Jag